VIKLHPIESIYPGGFFVDIYQCRSFSRTKVCNHIACINIVPLVFLGESLDLYHSISDPLFERLLFVINPMKDNLTIFGTTLVLEKIS